MDGYNSLFWIIFTVAVLAIGTSFFLLLCWLIDKYLLQGKFKKKWRILFSVAVPVLFLFSCMLYDHHAPYSTSRLNKELEEIGLGIELPPYKIVDYNEQIIPDSDRNYKIAFTDDEILLMIPQLDSLCDVTPNWSKEKGIYQYHLTDFDNCGGMVMTINPSQRTATCIIYNW